MKASYQYISVRGEGWLKEGGMSIENGSHQSSIRVNGANISLLVRALNDNRVFIFRVLGGRSFQSTEPKYPTLRLKALHLGTST